MCPQISGRIPQTLMVGQTCQGPENEAGMEIFTSADHWASQWLILVKLRLRAP